MKSLAAIIIACGLAASASAQCNLYRSGVPDFDQRRNALPNDGAMYCVPTSCVNLLGYAANHGVPGALSGPRNWQSQSNYAFIDSQLSLMGVLMGTDPFNGTSGGPAQTGLNLYLLTHAPGKFTVSQYYGDYAFPTLFTHFILGHLVDVCYGYYPVDSLGRYYRDGGHCVSLTGLVNYCSNPYTLRLRNPADDSANLNTQSTFASLFTDASSQTFIATDNLPRTRIRLWDLGVGSTTRRYLDTYITLNPLVALTGGLTQTDFLFINLPVQLAGLTPADSSVQVPGNDPIIQTALDPQQLTAFVVTSQLLPRQQTVFRVDLGTHDVTQLLTSTSPIKIATTRFGHLIAFADGSVRKYDVSGRAPVMVQQVTPSSPAMGMTYDDALDEVVIVTQSGRLIRYHEDLAQPPIDEPLPTGVLADGSVFIAIDPNQQQYFIGSSAHPTIYALGLDAGAPRLHINTMFALPAVQTPEDLQFTDEGHLLVLNNGVVGDFMHTAAAGWMLVPGSPLAGIPGGNGLCVARSRTNFVHGVHDTPEWRNVLADEGVTPVPDCTADFNNDRVVNSQDFFDFLSAFFAQNPDSDINSDGVINSQDFFDYLTAFFQGCP